MTKENDSTFQGKPGIWGLHANLNRFAQKLKQSVKGIEKSYHLITKKKHNLY